MKKCLIAANLFRLLENYGSSNGYQTGTKMSNGHLIAYRIKRIVRGLLNLSVAEPSIILLNYLSIFEYLFELFAVSRNS